MEGQLGLAFTTDLGAQRAAALETMLAARQAHRFDRSGKADPTTLAALDAATRAYEDAWETWADDTLGNVTARGGRCFVSMRGTARMNVTLRDGRVLLGCGVHGSGGAAGDAARARHILTNPKAARQWPTLHLIVVDEANGWRWLTVDRADVVGAEEAVPS